MPASAGTDYRIVNRELRHLAGPPFASSAAAYTRENRVEPPSRGFAALPGEPATSETNEYRQHFPN
jgi:hypothetical protein